VAAAVVVAVLALVAMVMRVLVAAVVSTLVEMVKSKGRSMKAEGLLQPLKGAEKAFRNCLGQCPPVKSLG
jgi:hypothetical protein